MEKDNYCKLKERYVLRHAAGEYFLLDMEQNGLAFKAPAVINETGADIWMFYTETGDIEETVKKFCAEYEIDEATAAEAVTDFLNDIENQSKMIDQGENL